MKKRNWFKYLDFWCNRKVPIGSGLSIPFLIGIESIFNEDYNLKTFFSEIRNTKSNQQVVCLRNCKHINEIVCCLDYMDDNEKKYYNNFDNLYFSLTQFQDIDDYKIFENKLFEKYAKIIKNKCFSRENENWVPFSKNNIEDIKSQIC